MRTNSEEPVLTVKQMRDLDEYYINNVSSGIELMGRAGDALAHEIKDFKTIAIVCGAGNNGGDGYAAAYSLLKNDNSTMEKIDIFYIKPPRSDDSKYYAERLSDDRVSVSQFTEHADFSNYDCVVDCLLGTGFKGAPTEEVAVAIKNINECKDAFVISMDINSGVNGDTGEGELFVNSDLTLSLGYKKRGFLEPAFSDKTKLLKNVNIGYDLNRKNLAPFDESEDILYI